jgi:hypothetical protein
MILAELNRLTVVNFRHTQSWDLECAQSTPVQEMRNMTISHLLALLFSSPFLC